MDESVGYLTSCPFCQCSIRADKLKHHILHKCINFKEVVGSGDGKDKRPVPVRNVSTVKISVKAELSRLYFAITGKKVIITDPEISYAFIQFYRKAIIKVQHGSAQRDSADENGKSIRAISGGLPGLGRR